jgi:non-specific serine/threonine protein kinase
MLASLKKNSCSLVIVPKSLLFNWCNELDKFCPTLSYLLHHGPKRAKMLEQITPYNIVLSTYDTAASDIAILRSHIFDYIVLDESQAIKNIQSKRYKAMRLLQSENKLAMTGTPIENNTFDLYAQLSFASPGLLNSSTEFKRNFSDPIDNHGNAEAASLLKKIVHPFILRRTKEQVAKDLPSKTVTTIYCEMEPTQRKLYDILKEQIKEDVYSAIEEDGLNKSRFKILEGLLRLRQMCNSPLLVNPNFKGKNTSSVKIDLLVNNLKDTLQKHNALVFSQFTSLLAIIRKELDRNKIKYAYLDGKTKDREAEVKKFMENDDIKLFLISIKAGNTGLNLTKADYVYIVDPWWNPAVEAQAIDRTHRIGQKKNIFAYKLICKDTIEEKILKLQDKKKGIADDIIQTDEKVFKKLKKEDLMDLLQ